MAFLLCLVLLLMTAPAVAGPLTGLLHGAEMGMGLEAVQTAIDGHTGTTEVTRPDQPFLPVAREAQTDLLVHDFELADGSRVARAGFHFADGALVLIEVAGGIEDALLPHAGPFGARFCRWDAYNESMMVVDLANDHAWILSKEAAHPHLFLWSGLRPGFQNAVPDEPSVITPPAFRFGEHLDTVEAPLRELAPESRLKTIDEPWLPTDPELQQQLDLYGIMYAGFPRKAEIVFGDGLLELVWILTGAGEEERIRNLLVEAYDKPVFVSEDYEAFSGWRVVLRKDKPEVLLLSERLAPIYAKQIQSQN